MKSLPTLQEAIDAAKAGDTVKLIADIKLTGTVTIAADDVITLDLNGKTISAVESATGSFGLIDVKKGNLTVKDSEGNGKITLSATVNRGWNAYSSVISNQQGTVTILGGTIEHLGGTDMAYGIDNLTNGKGTTATLNIEGGRVESAYFAVRQFANNGTNMLYITGGDHGYVWMQSPNSNPNVAVTSVTGGKVAGVCLTGQKAEVTLVVKGSALAEDGRVYGTAPD